MPTETIDPITAAVTTYAIAIVVSFVVAGMIKLLTETIHSFGGKKEE